MKYRQHQNVGTNASCERKDREKLEACGMTLACASVITLTDMLHPSVTYSLFDTTICVCAVKG